MISPYAYPGIQQPRNEPRRVSFVKITRSVCREFQITPVEIKSRRRKREIVMPRQALQTLLYNLTLLTTSQVARMFGGYNHSTITSSMKRMRADYQTNSTYRASIDNILSDIDAVHLKKTFMK